MIEHIHQIWFQGASSCPNKYNTSIARWKELHPSATYHFWDENKIDRFLMKYYPQYVSHWRDLDKLIKKCDCARYLILHHFGGLYVEMDTVPLRAIDELISAEGLADYGIILSQESNDSASWKSEASRKIMKMTSLKTIVGNAIIFSKPRQEFWIGFVEKSFERRFETVLESFSTWHLTKFISRQNDAEVHILPYRHLLGSDPGEPTAYALHMYDATWFDRTLDMPWEV